MVCKTPIFVVALRRRLIDCFLLPMDGFFLIESEALPLYITSLDLGSPSSSLATIPLPPQGPVARHSPTAAAKIEQLLSLVFN